MSINLLSGEHFLSIGNRDEINHLSADDIQSSSPLGKVYYFTKSWFREVCYALTTCCVRAKERIFGAPSEYVIPRAMGNDWKEGNGGLFLAIHGLNGRPDIWHNQLSTLRKEHSDFEVRAPHVPRKGNCSLEDAAEAIESMMRDYVEHNPGKPVCLMGTSNGGRVAMELEYRLRNTDANILVSSISGAFSGTKKMNLMRRLGVANLIYQPMVVEDLTYQSPAAKALFNRVNKALPDPSTRKYEFYASPNDFQIAPYTASLPILPNKQVNYFLVPGENHCSIVSKVALEQIERCAKWMQGQQIQEQQAS